jgi:hypothetical protein
MKSLKKIVGEVVLAGLCGIATGGAVGHTVEAVREGMHDVEKGKNSYIGKYEMDKRVVGGAAALGGTITLAIYLFKGNKRNVYGGEDSEEEERGKGL